MNYKNIEDDKIVDASINLGNARIERDANPENLEMLNEYIKANIEYYKISEAHSDL